MGKESGFKGRGLEFDVACCRVFGVEPTCKSVIKENTLTLFQTVQTPCIHDEECDSSCIGLFEKGYSFCRRREDEKGWQRGTKTAGEKSGGGGGGNCCSWRRWWWWWYDSQAGGDGIILQQRVSCTTHVTCRVEALASYIILYPVGTAQY